MSERDSTGGNVGAYRIHNHNKCSVLSCTLPAGFESRARIVCLLHSLPAEAIRAQIRVICHLPSSHRRQVQPLLSRLHRASPLWQNAILYAFGVVCYRSNNILLACFGLRCTHFLSLIQSSGTTPVQSNTIIHLVQFGDGLTEADHKTGYKGRGKEREKRRVCRGGKETRRHPSRDRDVPKRDVHRPGSPRLSAKWGFSGSLARRVFPSHSHTSLLCPHLIICGCMGRCKFSRLTTKGENR